MRQFIMSKAEVPLSRLRGFFDCRRIQGISSSLPEEGLLRAVERSLTDVDGDQICSFRLGSFARVKFHVAKRISSDSTQVGVFLIKEPDAGFVGPIGIDGDEDNASWAVFDDDDDDDEEERNEFDLGKDKGSSCSNATGGRYIMTVDTTGTSASWRFYALRTLQSRLPEACHSMFPLPVSCHLLPPNVTCLRVAYEKRASLSLFDIASLAAEHGFGRSGSVDELLTAFWAVELMRAVEAAHVAGFIHLGITPKTVKIRVGSAISSDSSLYDPNSRYSAVQGVVLSDLSESVDLLSVSETQEFVSLSNANVSSSTLEISRLCRDADRPLPIRYDSDWSCVASTIHFMLFGSAIEVVPDSETDKLKWNVKKGGVAKGAFWQNEMLWTAVIDTLLNAGRDLKSHMDVQEEKDTTTASNNNNNSNNKKDDDDNSAAITAGLQFGPEYANSFEGLAAEFPDVRRIRKVRRLVETWLAESCCKGGKSLKTLLQRVELAVLST